MSPSARHSYEAPDKEQGVKQLGTFGAVLKDRGPYVGIGSTDRSTRISELDESYHGRHGRLGGEGVLFPWW